MPATPRRKTAGQDAHAMGTGWAPLAAVSLAAGAGILLCSVANALSRSATTTTTLIYWAGLLLIAVPIFLRLSRRSISSGERLALVLLLGLALYCVKVVHDSPLFTFPDEFVHGYNANQIARHHDLFRFNPILPITPRYPGLEGAASALMTLTGMSSFAAGTILIGVARLVFMAALFLLFARLSGSARIAGLGVAIYTGSSNFLLWGAQFSYESLALPLLVVVLLAFVEREAGPADQRTSWTVLMAVVTAAIVVTHHLTSYAVVVVFVVLALLYRALSVPRPNPWRFALYSAVLVAVWLVAAARSTVGYLFPVLSNAAKATLETAGGEASPRTLFHSSPTAVAAGSTPVPARIIALAAVALLGVGMLYGVGHLWRRRRSDPLVLLFCLAALGFFGALALRFAPAAWETGNRAGEFLFIGLAFVVAYAAVELLDSGAGALRRRAALVAAMSVVLVGGAISGWPWDSQLARPITIDAEGSGIHSEPLALARWAKTHLPEQRFAAPEADARLLLDPGGEVAFTGQGPDIEDIVSQPRLARWQLPTLRKEHLRYIATDRRKISADNVRGYFFTVPGSGDNSLLPRGVVHKFARVPFGRVYDSGRIVLFDLRDRP